ncbi:MAG: Kazal-type serine protease inhibitor domain-containing protein [Byssovorax sp.]
MSLRSFSLAALSILLGGALLPLPTGCQSTCTSSSECDSSEYCSIQTAACLTPRSLGFCKVRPDACTDVLSPVCGCDGKTYANACEAARAGFSAAANGQCGANCGGQSAAKCSTGQFCDYPVGACSESSPTGSCKEAPNSCPDLIAPVCGCDGKTYDNACKASQAQVSISANGECACGGPAQIPCEEGRYCELAVGACLGASPTGTCKTPPSSCSAVESPVCGCDGKTYPNVCIAAQNKMSVTGTQTCTTVPDGGPDGSSPDSGGGGAGGGGD